MYKGTCLTCGKEFKTRDRERSTKHGRKYKPKFCSLNCYHEGQRRGLTTHKPRSYIELTCQNCNKVFKVEKRPMDYFTKKGRGKYCSKACYAEAKKIGRAKRLRRNAKTIANLKKEDARCEVCGFERYIEVAHIISSSDGGTYDLWNILFLCPNHHRLFDGKLLTSEENRKISKKVEYAKKSFKKIKYVEGYVAGEIPHRQKQTLYELYHKKQMSIKEIADKLKTNKDKILYWMKKHEIKRRTHIQAWRSRKGKKLETSMASPLPSLPST